MWKKKAKDNQKNVETERIFTSVIDGLKTIYKEKMKPIEVQYKFGECHSPILDDSEIEARPMVLLLGQYSTGKTTFIRTLLEKDFPGMNIGPEPTTDRFMAIMGADEDRLIPGNAAIIQPEKPFRALSKFGAGFLNRFQVATISNTLLDKVTFIDTPGVLSGEKQRLMRTYDYPQVVEWFAERAALIMLLFDAHKLDISDEFKRVIESLRGHEDKMRVVLNKADTISAQQLQRVYGALMWSLARVFKTPEVVHVYLGSFKETPLINEDTKKLLEADMHDLLVDLLSLPRNTALRRLNDLLKRAKLAKIHGYIINHLKSEMPSLFGKEGKQKDLIENLPAEFKKLQMAYNLHPSDFPEINSFKEYLKLCDFTKFPKMDPRVFQLLDEAVNVDIPKLMNQFPIEDTKPSVLEQNPFAEDMDPNFWMSVDSIKKDKYLPTFQSLNPVDGKLSGQTCKPVFMQSNLPVDVLAQVWRLSDIDKDGKLDVEEFCLALHLVDCVVNRGVTLPDTLPKTLVPIPKRGGL